MSRTRYHDFRQEDSTELFNNRLRGLLEAGVYLGYVVSQGGSGGLWVQFTHETDPDDSTKLLGKIITHDGVIIEEDENQDDVAQGSVSAGTPNIHYVVASYAYNKALPNNDVVYTIKQGTAGSPPTPPTLTEDEVLLCEIYLPSSTTSYSDSGVEFKNVAKKQLYGITDYELFSKFDNILGSGIYSGIELYEGSTSLDISISAGTWITNENAKIVELAALTDIATLTNPGSGYYKFAWLVGMHKSEDLDTPPDPDYILVQGTAVTVSSQATLPSNSDILTAAQSVDPKYTSADYINKLGLIRVENRSGTYVINYISGKAVFNPTMTIVHGGDSASSLNRPNEYYGFDGLNTVIENVWNLQKDNVYLDKPYTIYLDGEFKTDNLSVVVPSNVRLKGLSGPARLLSDSTTNPVVECNGKEISYDLVNPTVSVSAFSTTPPSGYVGKNWSIEATYQSGSNFNELKLSAGDLVWFSSVISGSYNAGIVVSVSDDWSVNLWLPTDYQTDGDPTDLFIAFVKRNIELEDIEVSKINSGNGTLDLRQISNSRLNNVRVNKLFVNGISQANWGYVEIVNSILEFSEDFLINPLDLGGSVYNSYNHLKLYDEANSAQYILGYSGTDTRIGILEYINPNNAIDFRPKWRYLECSKLVVVGSSGCIVKLNFSDQSFQNIYTTGDLTLGSTGSRIFVNYCKATNLSIEGTGTDRLISYADVDTVSNTSSGKKDKILYLRSDSYQNEHFLEHANEDRNLRLVSSASISWDLSSNTLTWDSLLKFDIPWASGYTTVAASSAVLSIDGDRLYLDIDREVTSEVSTTTYVRNKSTAITDRYYKNRVFLAIRSDDVIYLYDGTRIEDAQTVKIGSTPPPDGSVTYVKLSTEVTDHFTKFFKNYVIEESEDNSLWDDQVVFMNSGSVSFTYTSSTGIIAFSSTVDLSNVQKGDTLLLINTSHAGNNGQTREEILDVNDSLNRVTIAKGLAFTIGSASRWNGAIVRGNKVLISRGISTFSYDPDDANPGRITFSPALGFTQYQVRPGYVFTDSSDQEYVILDRDTTGTGSWIDIRPGLRDVDDSAATTDDHGSIRTNNNPFNIPMADMTVNTGIEFVPVDYPGSDDPTQSGELSRYSFTESNQATVNTSYKLSDPYDKRIRLVVNEFNGIDASPRDFLGLDWEVTSPILPIRNISITFIGTGIVPVYALGSHVPASTPDIFYIDGEELTSACNVLYSDALADIGNWINNRFQLVAGAGKASWVSRLPYGVHTFTLVQGDATKSMYLRGFVVINAPLPDTYPGSKTLCDAPGKCVVNGKIYSFSKSRRTSIDANPADWDKGSHLLRYVSKAGIRKNAVNYVKSFTDTGDITDTSDTISSVDVSKWLVGDLILTISGTKKYVRRITAKGASSIVCNAVFDYSEANATIYYYGSSFNGTTLTVSGETTYGNRQRNNEEIIQVVKVPNDFMSVEDMRSYHRGFVPNDDLGGYATGTMLGNRLSDSCTALSIQPTGGENLGYFKYTTGKIRFVFVGSGLSATIKNTSTTGNIEVFLDGVTLGILPKYTDDLGRDDIGGFNICGSLPYGQHILEIIPAATGCELSIGSFTVWGPKKPDPLDTDKPVLDLWESFTLSDSERDLGIDSMDGYTDSVSITQFGTIQMHSSGTIHFDSPSIPNFCGVSSFPSIESVFARLYLDASEDNGGTKQLYLGFYGSELTLVDSGVGSTGTWNLYIQDTDGQFKALGSTIGFSSSGATFLASDATTGGRRTRITCDLLGWHVLRLTNTNTGTTYVYVDTAEVNCQFHCHRSKKPSVIDVWAPWQYGGLDIRNTIPFNSALVGGPNLNQSSRLSFVAINKASDDQPCFVFYSPGGFTEVSATCILSGAATYATLYVDSDTNTSSLVGGDETSIQAGEKAIRTLYGYFYLNKGLHFAYVKSDINIYSVFYHARSIASAPNKSSVYQGSGLDYGRAMKGIIGW